ncbi:HAMP domain-containing protein [Nonomuraea phyllanthi]|uniref:histidine kinase n=1 Tax=Nonomuraea phyllanthi TaxID=2219224 RepID=A0A5C4WKU6_9ACTN|nr:HAMP domain-containing sensor histidine kinase [Nonomuraea phyllanthi]KAB8194665.1 HAMP domain-containing protein [Nonomuraea phyllanthi]
MVNAWHRYSIRARLAMVATAAMAVICTAVAVFVLLEAHHAAVETRADQLAAHAVAFGSRARRQAISPRLLRIGSGRVVQVLNPAGAVVLSTPGMAGKPPMTTLRPDPDAYTTTRSCGGPVFPGRCMIVLAYPFHRADGVWQLNMAVPDIPWYVGPRVLAPLVAGWLLLVGATAAGSYRIVGKTLEPVRAINGKLSQITASDLGHRVPVPNYRDELRDLAESANRTLDRAQSAVEQQLRFASDASHDLRNPLTAMRTRIEEMLMCPGESDWPGTADALLDSVERMQALVGDLLETARLDAGVTGRREELGLTELVRCEVERHPRKVAVRHRLAPGVIVNGERVGLTRLLNNLLDNAERHAASAVTVTLEHRPGTAVLEVCDDGEGVAPEQREVIFTRFARLEASRVRDPGGTGLGLPIARQIAEAHGGTLTMEDSPRGARFVLRLPAMCAGPPSGGTLVPADPAAPGK